jgi:S-adenosylmethionine/arginine decarboxylase-like enzyme
MSGMRDLAPEIYRQRLIIEGIPRAKITAEHIRHYLSELSPALGMVALSPPVTHSSGKFGAAGWIHWETSGAHFYAWDTPRLFFSVDIYTCAPFDPPAAIKLTRRHFRPTDLEYREL